MIRPLAALRNTVAALLGLAASVGASNCNEERPGPGCEPCDAVALLVAAQFNHAVDWTIPEDALAECGATTELSTARRKKWEQRACSELTALYAIRNAGWPAYKASFEEDVRGGYLCPASVSASGSVSCSADNAPSEDDGSEADGDGDGDGGDHPSIIGDWEGEPVLQEGEGDGGTTTSSGADGGDGPGDASDTSAESTESGEPETPPLDCPEPNTNLFFWGRATALYLRSESLPSFDPKDLTAPPFRGDECGAKVFSLEGCTATLVGPRHVLTARHCIADWTQACDALPAELEESILLFDYIGTPDQAKPVTGMQLVACGTQPASAIAGDWALLELDEPIEDRCPLPLPPASQEPVLCEPIYALGYPLGHPLYRVGTVKAEAPTAWVTLPEQPTGAGEETFFTTIDSMDSLSGAPVFGMDGRWIGMHVRGTYSEGTVRTAKDPDGTCSIALCPPVGCPETEVYGEAITLAHVSETIRAAVDGE